MFSCFFVSVLILDSFWWFVNVFHPSRIIFSVFHVFIYLFLYIFTTIYNAFFEKKVFETIAIRRTLFYNIKYVNLERDSIIGEDYGYNQRYRESAWGVGEHCF